MVSSVPLFWIYRSDALLQLLHLHLYKPRTSLQPGFLGFLLLQLFPFLLILVECLSPWPVFWLRFCSSPFLLHDRLNQKSLPSPFQFPPGNKNNVPYLRELIPAALSSYISPEYRGEMGGMPG